MSPRLTRGEFWLLNSLVSHRLALHSWSGPDRFLRDFHNRTPHGLTDDELLVTVLGLFNAGWVVGEVRPQPGGPPDPAPFVPTGPAIAAGLEPVFRHHPGDHPRRKRADPSVTVSLTPAGGAAWEAFAAPNWGRFLEEFQSLRGAEERSLPTGRAWRTIRAVNRERGAEYLRCWAALGMYDPAAVKWRAVAPFPATYWKTLPVGYEARFESDSYGMPDGLSRKEISDYRYREALAGSDSRHLARWCDWL